MSWLFGKKKTPEEMLRENQRLLKKSKREIDREVDRLKKEEAKLVVEVKKSAKADEMSIVRIQCKDIARTRAQVRKMMIMSTQIQAVSMKILALKSTHTMASAMK